METVTGAQPTPAAERDEELRQLALDAAIWAMPIVSFDAMRQAFFLDAGARYGDFVYLSRAADSAFQITTPNASSRYVYFNFNLEDGPVVLDVPPAEGAGLFGSLLDAWQVPIADIGPAGDDRGRGAKYLLLPPGIDNEVPAQFLPVRFTTNNGYGAFRAIPEDGSPEAAERAIDLVRQMRLYPVENAAAPPASTHVDIAGKTFDGIVRFDESYFFSLARMVDEEPPQLRDSVMLDRLRALGIEKGKAFAPTPEMRALQAEGARRAQALLLERLSHDGRLYWPDRQWREPEAIGPQTGFSFRTRDGVDVEARAATYLFACAPPRALGKASFYLVARFDGAGAPLSGGARYRLHVPADPPARQFWALTLYDFETAAFIQHAPKVEINSYQALARNPDGSVDLAIGGAAPAIGGANHLPTAAGRRWFAIFRFYGPGNALFDRSWKLPDIERLV